MHATESTPIGRFRASEICGESVHPNDDCNYGQSSNDIFPTAMHIAAYMSRA